MALITGTPYSLERDLGLAYNEFFDRLRPCDWGCLIDHDALWTTPVWYRQLTQAIAENPDAGMFTAVTNRIGRKSQIAPGCPQGHDMLEHFRFGAAQLAAYGAAARDITAPSPISGVVMCLSRETWSRMGGFVEKAFFGVDNAAHRAIAKLGKRIYLLPGLYVWHLYRADGRSHEGAPRVAKA